MSEAEVFENEGGAVVADDDDFYSEKNVAARRVASNTVFISHDNAGDGVVREGAVVPQTVLVGREGDEPEVRAELTNDAGEVVHSQVLVDEHPNGALDA